MFSSRQLKIVMSLLAALAIASLTWQTVRYRQRAALRDAALKTDIYEVEMESTLPSWLARAAGLIDARLPDSWQLHLGDWTLFQRTKSVSVTITQPTETVDHFAAFDDAEQVVLYPSRHLADVYPKLAGFWRLKSLWIIDAQLTPQDCRSLCNISSEFTLSLKLHNGSPGDMRGLRNAYRLTGLTLACYDSATFNCENLQGFNALRRLRFVTIPLLYQFELTRVSELAKLNLTELDLGSYKVTDSDMQALAPMPLEKLHVDGDDLTEQGHRSLATMKRLKSLNLYWSVRPAIIGALRNHATLTFLSLHGVGLQAIDAENLATCPQLKTVYHSDGDSVFATRLNALRPDMTINPTSP